MGNWESYKEVPVPLAEAQGLVIGKDLVVISGFPRNFDAILSNKVYALDLTSNVTSPTAVWRAKDDVPLLDNIIGLTHGGFVLVNNLLYICGGYIGVHPGPATTYCFTYNHFGAKGTQWKAFPSLPAERSGGGLFYDSNVNTLYYATGASRPDPANRIYTIDHNEAWSINLANTQAGWKPIPNVPYQGNHVGFTTVKYENIDRHYLIGGQLGEDEFTANLNDMYEWSPTMNKWIARAKLPLNRGHFSSSVVPHKNCGFSISGGSTNFGQTSDVTYYDIKTDSWTKIGELPDRLNTPVCAIFGEYYYCQSGHINKSFSWRRKMI